MGVVQIICLIALVAAFLIIALWQFSKETKNGIKIGWVFLALFLISLLAGVLGFYTRG